MLKIFEKHIMVCITTTTTTATHLFTPIQCACDRGGQKTMPFYRLGLPFHQLYQNWPTFSTCKLYDTIWMHIKFDSKWFMCQNETQQAANLCYTAL